MTSTQLEMASSGKLSWFTRVAYGLGDTAQNIVWGAMSILTFFYTDYAGISPITVGMVMLFSRFFDGFTDIIMGFFVERTHSKWGKSRPWILWMSIPFAASIVLIYTVPQTNETVQFIYLFVTYNFCTTICYTALNLPYGSLSAMMTRVSKERDMLSIVRMALSPLGKILAVSATLPLIHIFGNDQMAWVKVMSMWAILALILLLLCFWKCEEKVVIQARTEKTDKIPVKKALSCLLRNKYFWLATNLWMFQNVIFYVVGTTLPYYCKYILHDDNLFSILYLVEVGLLIGCTAFSPYLLKKYGKRNMSLYGVCFALAGQLFFLIDPYNFYFVLISSVTRAIGFAPLNSVLFGFFGDVVEYGQWKFHVRQEGLIFSGGSVGTKVGSGLTGAVVTAFLSYAGYVTSTTGSAVQPESALNMIINLYSYGTIFCWVVFILTLLAYKLDKIYPQIMRDLIAREAKGEM